MDDGAAEASAHEELGLPSHEGGTGQIEGDPEEAQDDFQDAEDDEEDDEEDASQDDFAEEQDDDDDDDADFGEEDNVSALRGGADAGTSERKVNEEAPRERAPTGSIEIDTNSLLRQMAPVRPSAHFASSHSASSSSSVSPSSPHVPNDATGRCRRGGRKKRRRSRRGGLQTRLAGRA